MKKEKFKKGDRVCLTGLVDSSDRDYLSVLFNNNISMTFFSDGRYILGEKIPTLKKLKSKKPRCKCNECKAHDNNVEYLTAKDPYNEPAIEGNGNKTKTMYQAVYNDIVIKKDGIAAKLPCLSKSLFVDIEQAKLFHRHVICLVNPVEVPCE